MGQEKSRKTAGLRRLALRFAAIAGLALPSLGWGAVALAPQSKLWLEGDSTLHKYSSAAAEIEFSAGIAPGAPSSLEEAVKSGRVRDLRLAVPVDRLRSGESGLDKNMLRALKGADHPEIVFKMEGYKIAGDSGRAKISASGTLSIAGVDRPAEIEASVTMGGDHMVIEGEQPLVMTDFGIKPPKFMLGAIKVDKRVVVKFHLELEQAADGPKPAER